jgi:predicted peptidase
MMRGSTPGAAEMTNALVQEVCKQYPRFDRSRIYLSGLSMGGKGTWLVAYQAPEMYAAIAPISAVAVQPKMASRKLASVYTWIICGEHDHLFTQGSREMYQAMSPLGDSHVKLTVVPGGDHGCWAVFYPDRSFYEQLMQHRREQ